jgi:hypothetical protein
MIAAPSGKAPLALASDSASVLEVQSLAYDVATGTAVWRTLALRLSELLKGESIVLFLLNSRSEAVEMLASSTPNLEEVPERFLQMARRHGRRLESAYGQLCADTRRRTRQFVDDRRSGDVARSTRSGCSLRRRSPAAIITD